MKTTKYNYDLVKSLHEQGLTNGEIKKLTNYSFEALRYIRNKLNIPTKTYREINLTENEEQIILGSLLGDGAIIKQYRYPMFTFSHSLKQERYALWKYEFLKTLPFTYKYYDQLDKRSGNITKVVKVYSRTNPLYNYYKEMFYNTGKKEVTAEIVNKLKPLGIAIWFQDDGYNHQNGYYIATNSFSLESCNIIKNYFKEVYNINCNVDKEHRLYILKESCKKFEDVIRPFMHEDLLYKLKSVLNKQGELLESPTTEIVNEDNQQPSLGSNTFEGSTTNSRVLNKDSNANTSALPFNIDSEGFATTNYNDIVVRWKPIKGIDY